MSNRMYVSSIELREITIVADSIVELLEGVIKSVEKNYFTTVNSIHVIESSDIQGFTATMFIEGVEWVV